MKRSVLRQVMTWSCPPPLTHALLSSHKLVCTMWNVIKGFINNASIFRLHLTFFLKKSHSTQSKISLKGHWVREQIHNTI